MRLWSHLSTQGQIGYQGLDELHKMEDGVRTVRHRRQTIAERNNVMRRLIWQWSQNKVGLFVFLFSYYRSNSTQLLATHTQLDGSKHGCQPTVETEGFLCEVHNHFLEWEEQRSHGFTTRGAMGSPATSKTWQTISDRYYQIFLSKSLFFLASN